ncbi:lipocalin family protein, partial [Christiangramia aquimixticola]|uniref:lipocalin family protein n=1 Tax=Christiangramia aquimixticola TaxID=1697558 RepID=UPI003AA80830
MRKLIVLINILLLVSCQSNSPQEQLKNLNGYWQIEKVEMEKDSVIEFSLSQYIDYIEMKDSTGFRKKLQPKLDGSYIEASNDAENIKAKIEENVLFLYYSTPYDNWKEKVLEATPEDLIIENRDGKKYYYKKYEPLIS